MPNKDMSIKIKHPLIQMMCRHQYELFEKPVDKEINPYGFVSLNELKPIKVCVRCGKGLDK